METPENQMFYGAFRGYEIETSARNGLKTPFLNNLEILDSHKKIFECF